MYIIIMALMQVLMTILHCEDFCLHYCRRVRLGKIIQRGFRANLELGRAEGRKVGIV